MEMVTQRGMVGYFGLLALAVVPLTRGEDQIYWTRKTTGADRVSRVELR